MAEEELTARLGFHVDEAPLHRVNELLEGVKGRLDILAAGEIVRGIYEIAERFSGLGDALELASHSAGLGVEAFQQLAFAAQQANVEQGDLSIALAHLSQQMYQVSRGSQESVEAFARLGFTPEQVASWKNSRQGLLAVSDAFNRIQNSAQKQALAMAVFGRSGFRFTEFLAQGSKGIEQFEKRAKDMGAVVSTENVESLARFEAAMKEFRAVVRSVGAMIGGTFAPVLQLAVKDLEKLIAANRRLIQEKVEQWIGDFAYALGFTIGIITETIKKVDAFTERHKVLVANFISVAGHAAAFSIVLGGLQRVLGILAPAFTVLRGSLLAIRWASELRNWVSFVGVVLGLKNVLVTPLLYLGELAFRIFPALGESILGVALAIDTYFWPALGVTAAVAALYVGIKSLWQIFEGKSFKDTELGRALVWLEGKAGKITGFVKWAVGYKTQADVDQSEKDAAGPAPSAAARARIAELTAGAVPLVARAGAARAGLHALASPLADPVAAPGAAATELAAAGILAPIGAQAGPAPVINTTVTVHAGPNLSTPQAARHIAKAVQDATDRSLRQAKRDTAHAAAY